MATGIIGTLSGVASLSYTPGVNAKVIITGLGGSIQVNGVGVALTGTSYAAPAEIFVGAGQTLTVTTGSGVSAVVSAIEES